ncbi:MAG TPA: hypothetical protein VGK97_12935 [Spongiibacteraceae bacterium]|jgi:hypothetical protein
MTLEMKHSKTIKRQDNPDYGHFRNPNTWFSLLAVIVSCLSLLQSCLNSSTNDKENLMTRRDSLFYQCYNLDTQIQLNDYQLSRLEDGDNSRPEKLILKANLKRQFENCNSAYDQTENDLAEKERRTPKKLAFDGMAFPKGVTVELSSPAKATVEISYPQALKDNP